MKALRKSLNTFLKAIHTSVYYERAPSTAVYPYLVFSCQLYPDGEGFELCTLAIDGWDNNTDTTALETLMSSVKLLDKATITNAEMSGAFYLENMIPLVDNDESIRRRQYNFAGRLYKRG